MKIIETLPSLNWEEEIAMELSLKELVLVYALLGQSRNELDKEAVENCTVKHKPEINREGSKMHTVISKQLQKRGLVE